MKTRSNRNFLMALACCLLFIASSHPVLAEISADISYSTPKEDDPGNEIDQCDIKFDYSQQLHQSTDAQYSLKGGLSIHSTSWTFDESRLGDVDLIKVKLPFTSTTVLANEKLFVATLTPGIHGDQDDLSSGDVRLEGQAYFILPRGKHKWMLGAGFSDIFGEPQLYPVVGDIWSVTEKLQLNIVFPALGATYTATPAFKYLLTIQPSGGSWSWEAKDLGVNSDESVDLDLKGIRTAIGAMWDVGDSNWLTLKLGIETNREIEISKHSDASINQTLDLVDSWFVQFTFLH